MKLKYRSSVVIKEIKRVWQPGMSANEIAAALNPKKVKLKKASIVNYFKRHKEALLPCYLPDPTRPPKQTPVEPPLYGDTYKSSNGVTLPRVFYKRP